MFISIHIIVVIKWKLAWLSIGKLFGKYYPNKTVRNFNAEYAIILYNSISVGHLEGLWNIQVSALIQ